MIFIHSTWVFKIVIKVLDQTGNLDLKVEITYWIYNFKNSVIMTNNLTTLTTHFTILYWNWCLICINTPPRCSQNMESFLPTTTKGWSCRPPCQTPHIPLSLLSLSPTNLPYFIYQPQTCGRFFFTTLVGGWQIHIRNFLCLTQLGPLINESLLHINNFFIRTWECFSKTFVLVLR